jgi:UDP-glucose 4-epimerase
MQTVVTGGAGFIGSTLVDQLVDAGHTVDVVDNFSTGSAANLTAAKASAGRRLTVHEIDIRRPETSDIIAKCRPEVVFHLAAQADVRVSVADAPFDADVNIVGGLRVLDWARQGRSRKVVFASSGGTIYGEVDADDLPITEGQPQRPTSPYGVAKKALGDYLLAYRELHGVEFTALALANVYGPRQDPLGEAGVVAIFAGLLLAGQPCTIFGDGTQTRDFIDVADVAEAFMRAADQGGPLLNIGTGIETSVNQLYRSMASAAGSDAEPKRAPARTGELQRSVLDPALAAADLGWKSSISLDAGVARVLEYFRAADRPPAV